MDRADRHSGLVAMMQVNGMIGEIGRKKPPVDFRILHVLARVIGQMFAAMGASSALICPVLRPDLAALLPRQGWVMRGKVHFLAFLISFLAF